MVGAQPPAKCVRLLVAGPAGSEAVSQVVARHVSACPVFQPPDGANPALGSLLEAAAVVWSGLPASSATAMERAARQWTDFLAWTGVTEEQATPSLAVAYMMARACPPVGVELPTWMTRRVKPATAVGEIDSLRRAARMGLLGMSRFAQCFDDARVLGMGAAIGGRIQKLKTDKRPVLFSQVRAAWLSADKTRFTSVRDAAVIVLGFFFGARRSEIVGWRRRDLTLDPPAVLMTFSVQKNRRATLPSDATKQVVAAQHPILLEAATEWCKRFDSHKRGPDDALFFTATDGGRAMAAATVTHIVRRAAQGCTAHSLRGGMATEAYAAGVPIERILTLGRWRSMAGLMYILGPQDETMAATQAFGEGGELVLTETGLRRKIATTSELHVSAWSSAGEAERT